MMSIEKFDNREKSTACNRLERDKVQLRISENDGEIIDFYSKHLATWERLQQLWKWREKGPPENGSVIAVVAIDNKVIVGSLGVVHAIVTLSGARFRVSWQQDSLVAPSLRGRGLGKRLAEEASENCDMAIGKGATAKMYGLRKSMGFEDVSFSNYLVQVLRPRFSLEKLIESFGELSLFLWKAVMPLPRADPAISVTEITTFDSTFDTLAEELATQDVLRVYKDSNYLNWRYFNCPGRDYKVFRAGGEQTRAAIVIKIAGSKMDEGWIVDLICPNSDRNVANALLAEATDFFLERSVRRVWTFATLPVVRKWFYRFGFLPTTYNPKFYYRVHDDGLRALINASKKWDFWHGDGDLELY